VERINGSVFFSKGWKSLRDFYGISLGALGSLVFVGQGQFVIVLKDRCGKVIKPPVFDPPMHFVIVMSKTASDGFTEVVKIEYRSDNELFNLINFEEMIRRKFDCRD